MGEAEIGLELVEDMEIGIDAGIDRMGSEDVGGESVDCLDWRAVDVSEGIVLTSRCELGADALSELGGCLLGE